MSNGYQERLPAESAMLLPLLEEIDKLGGVAKPGEVYDRLAARLDIPESLRESKSVDAKGRARGDLARRIRWVRQTAVARGLIDKEQRGMWALTSKARTQLKEIVRGKIITVFETERGIILWANAEDIAGVIERESVSLLWTSPPYPLLRSREYGNKNEREWVDWMLRLCDSYRGLLTPDGSMMLNLGPCWMPGLPQQSLYVERFLISAEDNLGLKLCQKIEWFSPNKLPTPMEWVAKRRLRLTPAVEPILWLSADPLRAKANNANVLRPYSKSGLRSIANAKTDKKTRPSGKVFGDKSFVDRGGSIAPSLITAVNCSSSSTYHRAERAAGRKAHPAVAPQSVIEFCIKLTTDKDDLVMDSFAGSGTTLVAAHKLNRRFIGSDRSLEYLRSAEIRCQSEGILTTRYY